MPSFQNPGAFFLGTLVAQEQKFLKPLIENARKALAVLESDINGRYSDELIGKMEDIYRGNKHVSTSEEITVLLQIGAVLEYNGTRWCDLHPLVEKWLVENNKITG